MYTTMDVKTVFKFLFSVFLSISFLLGLDRIINKMEENRCAMTFMFEYPQYIVSSLFSLILSGIFLFGTDSSFKLRTL